VRRRAIVSLIVTEAMMLGGVGAAVGALLGAALVRVVAAIGIPITAPGTHTADLIRPVIGAEFILQAAIAAVCCAAIAALYPAYRAARLSPVAALGAL
jgi:putative ABC transport system permease protein